MKHFPVLLVPAYNESERFSLNYFASIKNIRKDLRLIFIDDGSSDSTFELLKAATQVIDDSLVWGLDRNLGKANAIREGFFRARAMYPNCEWIGFLDADGSFYVEDVFSMISLIDDVQGDVD